MQITRKDKRRMDTRISTLALAAAMAATACSGDLGDSPSAPGGADEEEGAAETGGSRRGEALGFGHEGGSGPGQEEENLPPPTITPTGHLFLTEERLATLQDMIAQGDPRWLAFKAKVDSNLGAQEISNGSPENRALMYRLTGDPMYAAAAYSWAVARMQSEDVSSGQYLEYGNLMRHAAAVLNWCGDALTQAEKQTLVDYLVSWTQELWFDNQKSSWGLDDPGNNYHMAFLQGTAWAGYALREAGVAEGQQFIDLLYDKLQKDGGVLAYLESEAVGGGWHEGVNYGERSMQRLFDAVALVATMDGVNFFYEHPFFEQLIYYSVYALQNDLKSFYPGGDLARDSSMDITPAVRDYLQTVASFLPNSQARKLAVWTANDLTPGYDKPGYGYLAFRELAVGVAGDKSDNAALPLSYHSEGNGWLNFRTGWGADDVAVSVSAPYAIDQSHQHIDAGSFVMFRKKWMALDATSLSTSGLNWSAGAHNTIHVAGAENRPGNVGGVIDALDAGDYGYVRIDGTEQYRYRPGSAEPVTMLDEFTRELVYLRPGVVVLYDRVDAKDGHPYEWRLHTPTMPVQQGNRWDSVSDGMRLSVIKLEGGASSVASDADLPGGPSAASRVATQATGEVSRFLHVVSLDDASAAPIVTHPIAGTGLSGVLVGDKALLFSEQAWGDTPSGSMSYTVPRLDGRVHLVANQSGNVKVEVEKTSTETTVTLSPGGSLEPNAAGIVQLTE